MGLIECGGGEEIDILSIRHFLRGIFNVKVDWEVRGIARLRVWVEVDCFEIRIQYI